VESVTIEQTLPGLGVPEGTAVAPVVARTIGLSSSKRLMVVSGRSHPTLARDIVEKIGCDLGEMTLKTFASGETYCATRTRSAARTSSSCRQARSRSIRT
jgi:hypothetical protein